MVHSTHAVEGLVIGLDIGTSSCKGSLITTDGAVLGTVKVDYPVNRPQPTWAEQDVHGYWLAACAVLRQLSAQAKRGGHAVLGVGVVGQTPTEVFVDRSGRPLRSAIIWQDRRAVEEVAILESAYGGGRLREVLGIPMPITASWSPTRLLWVRRNQPEIADKVHKVLQPKDYINFCLTGEYASDSWSSKSLAHVETHAVDDTYLGFLGFGRDVVPRQFDASEVVGVVHEEAATQTGLPEGTPVVGGWTDALAAMLASGAFASPGSAFNCTGTSEIVGITEEDTRYADGLFTVPRKVIGSVASIYGPTQSGGASLLWARSVYGGAADGDGSWLDRLIGVPAGSDGLVFLPYLEGERAPIWDAGARGVFVGATSASTREHFGRAVLEGVAYSVRHVLEVAWQGAPKRAEVLRLLGGGARHGHWCQIRADIVGMPVETLSTDEAGALGGAMLAAVGAGAYPDIATASRAMATVDRRFEPDASLKQRYDDLFEVYKTVYVRLADLFPVLAG